MELCLQCDGATKSTIKKSLAAAPAAGLPQREGETAVFVVRGAAPIEIELCHLIKQFHSSDGWIRYDSLLAFPVLEEIVS